MPRFQFLRSAFPLLIGLVIGGVGAVLFSESLPGKEGSPEERARKLEVDLKRAENRVRALEAEDPLGRRRPGRSFADGSRRIAEDVSDGKLISPDDVLHLFQPGMRALVPLLDHTRVRQQQELIDGVTGELTRKYGLTAHQREALKAFFEDKAAAEAKRWTDLVSQDGTTIVDLMRAAQDVRPDDGLDAFMDRNLSGEKLTQFKADRMAERVERVQQEADTRVERLDSIVGLDETQRDQVFGIMARGSKDYDPSMGLEGGAGEIDDLPAGEPSQAVMSVLRPDQRAVYEEHRERKQIEAAKNMEAMGLALPTGWDFEEFNFDQ